MPEHAELWRKTGQRGLLVTSYRGLKKDSARALTPVAEAARVLGTLGTARGPASQASAPPSCPSHWGRAATGKKKKVLCLFAQGHFGHVQLFVTLKTVACQAPLSGRGALQERILEGIAPNLVLPEPLRPKQLHHLHADPHRGKPKSSRAGSGANPSGRPTCRGGNKTTIETQGQHG